MSDQGFFAVHRGVWDHPSFAPEAFTEREAWFWMLSSAAWEAKSVRVGRAVVNLRRGQLAFSLRFLADKFKWSEARVRRRITRMICDALIDVKSTREATIITIRNYDKYQLSRRTDDTSSDAQNEVKTTHRRRKEEEINNLTTNNDDADAPRAGSLVTPAALQITEKLLVIAGHDPSFWPPGWCGAPMRVQTWLSQGWAPEVIVAAVTGAAARKRGSPANSVQFFENAIAEEVARQSSPLPTVEIKQAPNLMVYNGTNQVRSGGSLIDALKRDLAKIEGEDGADNTLSDSAFLRISG